MSHPILALDVDGVIIEGFPKNRWDETIEADLGLTRAELTEHFFQPHWQGIMIGKTPMMPVLTDVLVRLGRGVSAQELVDYWHGNDANVREDVIAAGLAWKARTGGQLALATNQEHVRADYLWQGLGFSEHFDTMVVSCRIGAQKPEADYFRKADEVLGRVPEQAVIFIDDLADNVASAAAHGWQAHHAESCDHAATIIKAL